MNQAVIQHFWQLALSGKAHRVESYGSGHPIYFFSFTNAQQEAWPEIFGDVQESGCYYDRPELAFWMERGNVVCEW